MAATLRDCADCGAPVGRRGRELCCLCWRRLTEQAAKQCCPRCGKPRVLRPDTGRCVLCSRVCTSCGHPVRARTTSLCRGCRRGIAAREAQRSCPRCGRPGLLREATGWCGRCSRPRPGNTPPQPCRSCGRVLRLTGLGLCSACWQRNPDRPVIQGENLITELADPPAWLREFIADLAARHCAGRACTMITALGRLLGDQHANHPQALLERARRPGRSRGTLARALEDFFTERRLALPTDHAERLAAGRRQRRIDATPAVLRPAVGSWAEFMLRARQRARRAGTRPRGDHTIETALATARDLAGFLVDERGKHDWALVDVHDIEAFLAVLPATRRRRLTALRQFFRFARTQRILLVDPTRGLTANQSRGFRGQTLTLDEQRGLFRRWTTDPRIHPHEALLGIALLHGAACREVRLLALADIDHTARTIRLGTRPYPVPLDPASWSVLHRCLTHRQTQRTDNPHVIVTRGTKTGRAPASAAYLSHLLDAAGVPARTLRGTRLAGLVNTIDAKLVAAAFGMNPEGVLPYLADHVDPTRTPEYRT